MLEAVKSGKEIDQVLIQNRLKIDNFGELHRMLKEKSIPFKFVPPEKMKRLAPNKNHQGVIAFISEVVYQNIENVLPEILDKGKLPLLLILDRITDVRNFGAIARTAACTGVDAIIIPSRGAAQINADAVKTSAGALNTIPVCRSENLKNTIEYLKNTGIKIISCTEKTERLIFESDLNTPCAIIMGSEEDGISGEYLKRSDESVKIPITGTISSLNVSVAAGIILYEAIRQRGK